MSYIAHMNAGQSIRTQRRTRLFGYAVLAALLLIQVGYANHHDEHAIGDTVESCELCIQLENNGNALAAEPAAFTPDTRKDALPTTDLYRNGHQYLPTCRARAPPSV